MKRTIPLVAIGLLAVAVGAYVLTEGRSPTDGAGRAASGDEADVLRALEARLAAFESDIGSMADHQAILENELQYTRGLDRHDDDLIRVSFWSDAMVSYGTLVDLEDIDAWAHEGHASRAAHQHHVTTLSLDIDADRAHEEGYILFSSDMRRDTRFDTQGEPSPGRAVAGSFATLGTGRYVNRYARRDGDWRMVVHEYVHDVSMLLEAVDLCATRCIGTWDPLDISYLRPLQPLSVEERRHRAERGMTPRSRTASRSADDTGDRR